MDLCPSDVCHRIEHNIPQMQAPLYGFLSSDGITNRSPSKISQFSPSSGRLVTVARLMRLSSDRSVSGMRLQKWVVLMPPRDSVSSNSLHA